MTQLLSIVEETSPRVDGVIRLWHWCNCEILSHIMRAGTLAAKYFRIPQFYETLDGRAAFVRRNYQC